eukprot:UN08903
MGGVSGNMSSAYSHYPSTAGVPQQQQQQQHHHPHSHHPHAHHPQGYGAPQPTWGTGYPPAQQQPTQQHTNVYWYHQGYSYNQ